MRGLLGVLCVLSVSAGSCFGAAIPKRPQGPAWWQSLTEEQRQRMGLHKLTAGERDEIARFFVGIFHDRAAAAAAKYLEQKGWEKMTVLVAGNNGKLVLRDSIGRKYIFDPTGVGFVGIARGEAVWVESTVGITDVIGPDGDEESGEIEDAE